MNKRISDMMDGFIDESVNIELSEQASSKRITEAVMSKIHNELNDKTSEISRLQMELNRREDVNAENFKRLIATLEKENNSLKVAIVTLICNMSCFIVKNLFLIVNIIMWKIALWNAFGWNYYFPLKFM